MVNIKNIKPHRLIQIGVGALIAITILNVETRAVVGALGEHDGFEGWSWAAISACFAILAAVSFAIAGSFKEDYRPHVNARAFPARVLAIALAIVPASFFGSAIKSDNIDDRWAAYTAAGPTGVSAYQIDLDTVEDVMGDTMERREARARIQSMTPGSISLSIVDGEFWIAIFFQAILLFAADTLRVPNPMTKEEYEILKRREANAKRRDRRRAMAKRKETAEKERRKIRLVKE